LASLPCHGQRTRSNANTQRSKRLKIVSDNEIADKKNSRKRLKIDAKKKKGFNFGRRGFLKCGRLHLRRSFSNIFVTFTDLSDKVIVCKTSGNSGIIGSKRRKRVVLALEEICKNLAKFLELYKISKVEIILHMRKLSVFFYNLIKELSYYGISIKSFSFRKHLAFNGTRYRKLRRI